MGARAMWKGVLVLGKARIPLKLYSALEDRRVHFRLLHEKDRVPVEQRMVNPLTDEQIPWDRTLRGFETDDGRMVILDEEDQEELEPEASRDIEVLRFVEPEVLPHVWYDRPYYLGPDGDAAAWSALGAALERTGLEGVVRWTMRKKSYHGALRAHAGAPMLIALRSAEEVVDTSALSAPGGRELAAAEIDMATKLVGMLEGPFEPGLWRDAYRERVQELIDAKSEGRTVSMKEYTKRTESEGSLADALAASLEAAGGRKSA